jgi:hypothetical protein
MDFTGRPMRGFVTVAPRGLKGHAGTLGRPRPRRDPATKAAEAKGGQEVSDVRIADGLRSTRRSASCWRAIADPAAHARWRPFVTTIAGGHELHRIGWCSVQVGKTKGSTKESCVEREEGARTAWAIEEDSTGFGRMVCGWRSGFSLAQRDGATIVTAHSTCRPNDLVVRAMLP